MGWMDGWMDGRMNAVKEKEETACACGLEAKMRRVRWVCQGRIPSGQCLARGAFGLLVCYLLALLFVSLALCLSVCQSACLFVCLSVCLSVGPSGNDKEGACVRLCVCVRKYACMATPQGRRVVCVSVSACVPCRGCERTSRVAKKKPGETFCLSFT